MSRQSTTYDVIVVGCVIAARLSEHQDARVLLLEAGSATPPPDGAVPPLWPTLSAGEWNWGETSTIQSATGRATPVPRGRGVGGSTAINAMIFARGHRASYAGWEDAGAKGWNFDALLPYFKRTETAVGRDPALRGVDGPLIVKAADPLNELHAAGLAAAVQSGYRRASDISGGLEVGFGPVDLNIIDGQRQSGRVVSIPSSSVLAGCLKSMRRSPRSAVGCGPRWASRLARAARAHSEMTKLTDLLACEPTWA